MKSLSKNKKAYFDYEVLENFSAGIVLSGAETKSCRLGRVQLKGSYLTPAKTELFIEKLHISPYQAVNQSNYNPLRKRKVLLTRKEINKIIAKLEEKGVSAVPLEMYLDKNLIKLKIGLCRGKKKYDKREALKKKSVDREVKRVLKRF